MVSLQKIGANYSKSVLIIEGASTDEKPIGQVEGVMITNGSEFSEIDTGSTYKFDHENQEWLLQPKPGGGGGADGLSAYEIAVKNGFVGTESEWLVSLKGADGAKGTQGIQGIQGAKGDTGTKGADGSKGDKGDTGPKGDIGLNGATGAKGATGATGAVGKNGASITAIAFSKDETGALTDGTATLSDNTTIPITIT